MNDDQKATVQPPAEEQPVKQDGETTPEIPKESSDRTKEQFEKLKDHNKALKEENIKYKNVLESLRPEEPAPAPVIPAKEFSHLDQKQVDSIAQDFVDKDGYVDMSKLNTFLKETNERAIRAEKTANEAKQQSTRSVRDFEETATVKKAHDKYPELDPENSKFNSEFYDVVRNELVGQMLKGGKEDLLSAADKWHIRMFGKKETKEEIQQREKGNQARIQINATPTGRSGGSRNANDDISYLQQQTRLGSTDALKERLARIGL